MTVLGLMQLEELDGVLLDATTVVAAYDRQGADFTAVAVAWMFEIEEKLGKNRLALAGRVATMRAELVSHGRVKGDGRPRPRRTERNDAAVRTLRQVVEIVHLALSDARHRIDEADALARRVVALSEHKGLTPRLPPASDWVRATVLYEMVAADPDLAAGVVQLNVLLGRRDAVIALSRRLIDVDPEEAGA